MKKHLVFLLFIFPSFLVGQIETVEIEWETNHRQLHFSKALYADGANTLPYLGKKIPWESAHMVPSLKLEVKESEPVDAMLVKNMAIDHLEPSPLLEYSLAGERGRTYLIIKILPFFIDEHGEIRKILTFELVVESEPAMARLKHAVKSQWTPSSVLASGSWYKIAVEESGIHKLTYEHLQSIGLENPASVRIYGSGARVVSEQWSEDAVDDLKALPVYMEKGGDGLFGPGDYILFYAEGPVSWEYDADKSLFVHHFHDYSNRGYYFLTDGLGPTDTPGDASGPDGSPAYTVNSYDFRLMREDELYNLIHSGREWYGDAFKLTLERAYAFQLPGIMQDEALRIQITAAGRAGSRTHFQIKADGQNKGRFGISPTNLSYYTSTYAHENDTIFNHMPTGETITLQLAYTRSDENTSGGWLDHIILNGRARLDISNRDQLSFRDVQSTGAGAISRFLLSGGQGCVVWDITDPGLPLNIPYSENGSSIEFKIESSALREFIAFRPEGTFPVPAFAGEGLGPVPNQNLHGLSTPDMIIICPALFREEAERLAEHRRNNDGLNVEVVLQEEVFNEFSSGTPDISAIRNFLKMFYDRATGYEEYCRYLLLFGDGSFDNRGRESKVNNPNFLLTYQSPESLAPTRSYTSDDFFGLLDTGEKMYDGLLDIGIGRLPASSLEEAASLVDKLLVYDEKENQGSWRNQLCFIGDDEDANIHMRQADELAKYVNQNHPAYNINKIYLDAYPQSKSATGFSYPDVERAINNQVNLGALIINYTGHGGTGGLAHEKVVTLNSIKSWSNGTKLPLFMTATCEFSRYDEYDIDLDINEPTAGEQVLLSAKGGGIGLFTTTRLVYSGPNHILNQHFYEVVFEKNSRNENYRLGDIIAYSKNETGPGVNKRNFTLLGDPSMKLSYPEHRVVTDSINSEDVLSMQDTLSAFDWVRVSGHLEHRNGQTMDDFSGHIYPLVFDKQRTIETLSNDDDGVFSFQSRNNILYSGKATVKNGQFTFGFYVPKDISYSYGPGKISYYANDSLSDAHGSWEQFIVGGIGSDNVEDLVPPEVELFINDTFFISGGISDPNPWLLVRTSDNYGINTTGNGIGHDLTAMLDGNRVEATILNEFFQSNSDQHNAGTIRYPYYNLEEGRHDIIVKIWDIHNNSTEETIEFVVVSSDELVIENLFNYPNPFMDQTFFNVEHNRPDTEFDVRLSLYDMNGKLVRMINERVFSGGYRLEPLRWDGKSSSGARLGNGIYLYRIQISTNQGDSATDSGKLILMDR